MGACIRGMGVAIVACLDRRCGLQVSERFERSPDRASARELTIVMAPSSLGCEPDLSISTAMLLG